MHCINNIKFIWDVRVLTIAAFCIGIYGPGQRLSSLKLLFNVFGIIPIVDSTSGVILATLSCHILASSSFKSVYFWSFSVMVL